MPKSGSRRARSDRSSRRPSARSSKGSRPNSMPDRASWNIRNDESQVLIGEAAAAERAAEEAVVEAAQAVAAANERSADTRERRAAAAARAEAQQARSAEFARASVEKFECVPQRLPEKLGFDSGRAAQCRRGSGDAGAADRRTRADRAGQSRRRAGACRTGCLAKQGRRGSRGADPGDPSPARLDRQPQPRRPCPAARRL